MNTRRSFIHTALAASTASLIPTPRASGAEPAVKPDNSKKNRPSVALDFKAIHRGSMETDQRLLALSDPPQSTKDFFAEARQIFENNRKASFSDLPQLGEAAAKHGLAALGGPMLGALTHNGARIWLRTTRPARVEVTVRTADGELHFGPVESTAAGDLTAVVPVTGLAPASRNPYRVLVDGKQIPIPGNATIKTPPAPGQPGQMTFTFGSCFHKSGLGDRALFEQMRLQGACAFLSMGDCAVDDRDGNVGLHRSDYLLRDLQTGWKDFAAGTAIYAAWDDHDYFNNDRHGIPPGATNADRSAVRTVWTQNWNNPSYGFKDRGMGIFFHTRLGPCDLIMLDTRSLRTRPGDPDAFLGEDQMRWLERELAACTAPFVFLTSGTMWSDNISNAKDSWGIWDVPGRERIFSLIEKLRLPVILLSGDRHGARVINIPRSSGRTLPEIEPASLGGHPGPAAFGSAKENQPFGLTGRTLFGKCTIDTTATDPAATVSIVDTTGKAHWQHTFTRSELTRSRI